MTSITTNSRTATFRSHKRVDGGCPMKPATVFNGRDTTPCPMKLHGRKDNDGSRGEWNGGKGVTMRDKNEQLTSQHRSKQGRVEWQEGSEYEWQKQGKQLTSQVVIPAQGRARDFLLKSSNVVFLVRKSEREGDTEDSITAWTLWTTYSVLVRTRLLHVWWHPHTHACTQAHGTMLHECKHHM